ncbi:MAG: hypothetical protein CALGDGBN_01283 [Pseudomonadales bacterium]|nr:hypothetical protein [Pseudomonadales bacterium]
MTLDACFHGIEVALVGGGRGHPDPVRGRRLQPLAARAREHAAPVGAGDVASVGAAQRGRRVVAEDQQQRLAAAARAQLHEALCLWCIEAVGEEQDAAGRGFALQHARCQRQCGGDRLRGLRVGGRHQRGAQVRHIGEQHVGVVAERQHPVRGGAEHQQRGAGALAARQQGAQLELRAFQPGRRHVDGVHRRRQVERHHQGGAVLDQRHRLALPGRSRQPEAGQRHREQQRMDRAQSGAPTATDGQRRQQVRIDAAAPRRQPSRELAPGRQPEQRQQRCESPQRPGPQEMELHRQPGGRHGASPRRATDHLSIHARSAPSSAAARCQPSSSATAAPSGHACSARCGRHDRVSKF